MSKKKNLSLTLGCNNERSSFLNLTMKVVLALLLIARVITAHPLDDEKPKVEILKQEIVHKADKGYTFE